MTEFPLHVQENYHIRQTSRNYNVNLSYEEGKLYLNERKQKSNMI